MAKQTQRRLMSIVGLLLAASAVTGCKPEPKIDSSSEQSMQESAQLVRESLPPERRGQFDEALATLALSSLDFASILSGTVDADQMVANTKAQLHGLTAEQVIAEAGRAKAEREIREREQAFAEIAELQEKQNAAAVAREKLKDFEVKRSRFYLRERRYSGKEPVIEMTVLNGTDSAVSRAFFKGVVASPGRSVPWISEDFNYSIRGGLEPGEEQKWSLAPNQFSAWGTEVPDDAILTVTVERLDGADDQPLFGSGGFSERDERRLEALIQQYGIEN